MIVATQISHDLTLTEQGVQCLSDMLGDDPSQALLMQLETVQQHAYAVGVGLSLAPYCDAQIAADVPVRLADAESTLDLIGRHCAMTLSPDDIPDRLRRWQTLHQNAPVYLPAIPRIGLDDPTAYAATLSTYLRDLSDGQKSALVAGSLGLAPKVNAALLAMPDINVSDADTVALDAPLLPLITQIFNMPAIMSFVADMVADDRINLTTASTAGFAFSIVPTYGGLPLIHVPLTGSYNDLIQLAHHIGHSYHQMTAQKHGTVLAPITSDIDEIIPLSFERHCHAFLCDVNPAAAAWVAAKRDAEVAVALRDYRRDQHILRAALADALPAALIADFVAAGGGGLPGYRPPQLSSYAFGAIASAHLWRAHGWDFDVLHNFATQADRASPTPLFTDDPHTRHP